MSDKEPRRPVSGDHKYETGYVSGIDLGFISGDAEEITPTDEDYPRWGETMNDVGEKVKEMLSGGKIMIHSSAKELADEFVNYTYCAHVRQFMAVGDFEPRHQRPPSRP